jgi:hypothetical protein
MSRFGWAWLALALALGVHVADEATSGFLAFYNSLVLSIRAKVPLFPMPTFTYDLWISGLIMFVLMLLALAFQAFEGKRWLLWPAVILGVIMTLNGLGHTVGSLYYGRILPGTLSAPLLLITGPWLVREAQVVRRMG